MSKRTAACRSCGAVAEFAADPPKTCACGKPDWEVVKMADEVELLTLENIAKGALPELFQRELDAVIANIADVNTPKDKKRSIAIKFTFEPFDERDGFIVEVACETKLAGVKAVRSTAFIDTRHGTRVAVPQDQRQKQLFGAKDEAANVLPMDKKKEVN